MNVKIKILNKMPLERQAACCLFRECQTEKVPMPKCPMRPANVVWEGKARSCQQLTFGVERMAKRAFLCFHWPKRGMRASGACLPFWGPDG